MIKTIKRLLAVVLSAVAFVSVFGCTGEKAVIFDAGKQLSEGTYQGKLFTHNPVTGVENGADPCIMYDEGWYYMYPTTDFTAGGGYGCYRSKDLWNWENLGACYVTEAGKWAVSGYWAPDVAKIDGKYYMFYTASIYNQVSPDGYANSGIGVAVADKPWGPFTDLKDENGESMRYDFGYASLDAAYFRDDDGKHYLYYCRGWTDNFLPNGKQESWIYGGEVYGPEKNFAFKEEPKVLLKPDANKYAWHNNIVEGPYMTKRNGIYYLTYSSGYDEAYSVGCAMSREPLGTFEHAQEDHIFFADGDSTLVAGSGHHAFVTSPEGDDYIIYHTNQNPVDPDWDRIIDVDRVYYTDEGIYCSGPTVEYVWYPRETIGYYNIAPEGKVTAENTDPDFPDEYLNDNRIVCNYIKTEYEWHSKSASDKITVKFDSKRAVKAIAIYSSADRDNSIEEATVTVAGVTATVKFFDFSTGVAIAELERAVYADKIEIEVAATDGFLALSEVVVLGL